MTIRERTEDAAFEQAAQASIKHHESGIDTLYITSSGEIFWDCQPSESTWLHRDDGTLKRIYSTGTGSTRCNCEACGAGDDPKEWAGDCDGVGDLADLLSGQVSAVAHGFFDDEEEG